MKFPFMLTKRGSTNRQEVASCKKASSGKVLNDQVGVYYPAKTGILSLNAPQVPE